MATLTLRKVGGSVVATFPKTLLDLLNAGEGDKIEYTFSNGNLIISSRPKLKPKRLQKFDMNKLLEEHKQIMPLLEKEYSAWEKEGPKGSELL